MHFNMVPGVHTGRYDVDKNQISVSGLSSGAYFAVQFHVSFSKTIMGAGIVAGGREIIAHLHFCILFGQFD